MTLCNAKSYYHGCCGNSAVAGTSMRIIDVLGTALLAVSLLIVGLVLRN